MPVRDADDGDYQHDEAHDLVDGHVPAPKPDEVPASSHTSQVPPAAQLDGDYSYDQAHDFGQR